MSMSSINPGPGAGTGYNAGQPSTYSGATRAAIIGGGGAAAGAGAYWQYKLMKSKGTGIFEKAMAHQGGFIKGLFKGIKANPGKLAKSLGAEFGSMFLLMGGGVALLQGLKGKKAPTVPNNTAGATPDGFSRSLPTSPGSN
jgi:hypothetical protein